MKSSLYFLAATAANVLAQNSSTPTAPPDCAVACTTKFLSNGATGFCNSDEACFCQDAIFWADITCCFEPHCTTEEERETWDYLVYYCKQLGSSSVSGLERRNPVGCPELPSSIYAGAVPTATGSAAVSATGNPSLDMGGISQVAESAIAVAILLIAALFILVFYLWRKRSLKRALGNASTMPKQQQQPLPPPPPSIPFDGDIELPPYSRTDEGWGKHRSDEHDTMGEPVKPFETV